MGLQWMVLGCVVATEAAIAVIVMLPSPKLVKSRIISLVSIITRPLAGVIPFAAFQILGSSLIPSICDFQDLGHGINEMIVDYDFDYHYVYDHDNDCVSDIYWKNEHRLMCTSDTCTATERDRYEKSVCIALFYFICVYRVWEFWILN